MSEIRQNRRALRRILPGVVIGIAAFGDEGEPDGAAARSRDWAHCWNAYLPDYSRTNATEMSSGLLNGREAVVLLSGVSSTTSTLIFDDGGEGRVGDRGGFTSIPLQRTDADSSGLLSGCVGLSKAMSRVRFLRLRLRASADLTRFFWPGFK
jgi:hypothetical protein